ncbi:hypothetical protein PM082_006598 [Marasmius tenuissimus]|nr:hypothetical protein PM082_006598 [Marasmius tenuissimus]
MNTSQISTQLERRVTNAIKLDGNYESYKTSIQYESLRGHDNDTDKDTTSQLTAPMLHRDLSIRASTNHIVTQLFFQVARCIATVVLLESRFSKGSDRQTAVLSDVKPPINCCATRTDHRSDTSILLFCCVPLLLDTASLLRVAIVAQIRVCFYLPKGYLATIPVVLVLVVHGSALSYRWFCVPLGLVILPFYEKRASDAGF